MMLMIIIMLKVTDDTTSNKNIEALKNDLVDGEFDLG